MYQLKDGSGYIVLNAVIAIRNYSSDEEGYTVILTGGHSIHLREDDYNSLVELLKKNTKEFSSVITTQVDITIKRQIIIYHVSA